jgi:cytidylate kinase
VNRDHPKEEIVTTPLTTLDQSTERVILAHWQQQGAHQGLQTPPALTIALTRESGTQGTSVAREIGTRLNWPVYGYELVEMIAQKVGLRASLLDSIDERRKSWMLEYAEGLSSTPGLSEIAYTRHLVETILSLGTLGHCVIVGRGAAQILPQKSTLRVRLVGLLPDRVRTAGQQRGLSPAEAERYVKERDKQRDQFVKSHFFKDPSDPTQCDLLLNRSRWSVAESADLIVQTLRFAEQRAMESGSTENNPVRH